ncbi:MAG: 3-oxoacyl-[acyl-carrier-protein] reductase FabG [Pseudomonadota bacterium]|jgi:3-oxoacyl-[acyl-carrier protein] reductase
MDLGLKGKRALVLAGTKGLGAGVARALAAEGVEVMICGRSNAAQTAKQFSQDAAEGGLVHGMDCDVYDRSSLDALLDATLTKLGGIDILVLNGGGPPPGPAVGTAATDWELWFSRMFANLVHAANRCLPAMRERQWGRLLTIASSAAVQPLENMGLSNSIRAGLLAWNKTLSLEVAADGVTCNMLLPGRIDTDRVKALDQANATRLKLSADEVREQARLSIPARRYGTAEEFGAVGAFICSERAAYMTGSAVRVDGGLIKAM